MIELKPQAADYLRNKFNVILEMDCRDFDQDFQIFIDALKKIKQDKFNINDKIVLCHFDTDYYDPLLSCGIMIINIVRSMQIVDIPMSNLIFVTNHFGIKKEFDFLLSDMHPADRPIIVETLLSDRLLGDDYQAYDNLDTECIEKSALCMMNRQRSHRVALYNFLANNNLLDHVAVSVSFKKTQ